MLSMKHLHLQNVIHFGACMEGVTSEIIVGECCFYKKLHSGLLCVSL